MIFPTGLKMMEALGRIILNYWTNEEMEEELREYGIEEFATFDEWDRVTFFNCEFCAGPELGHRDRMCMQAGSPMMRRC